MAINTNKPLLNMCLKKIVIGLFFLNIGALLATDSTSYYLLYLKDKPNSENLIKTPEQYLSANTLARRQKYSITITEYDVPVNEDYINLINQLTDIQIHNKSKWLNAVEIKSSKVIDLKELKALSFVSQVIFLGRIQNREQAKPEEVVVDKKWIRLPNIDDMINGPHLYSKSLEQNHLVNVLPLHQSLKYGSSLYIGVFDAGFHNAYKVNGMENLLDKSITKDFVTHDNSVWEDDKHGANCLSFMKTFAPNTYIGTAPFANYLLCRTEEAASEYPTEEFNWIAAAEYADSIGVDMIVSSLGYNVFDDASLSHTHKDLDGKTSIIAQAANFAFSRGIVVVTSAGNEGDGKWHKIGTPADAQGVICVGATNSEGFHVAFSSYGYSADKRVKPDFVSMGYKAIVASPEGFYGGNGTSYATPILAGGIACLMQAYPMATPIQIKDALRLSASHSQLPDTAYGYGLPDLTLAAHILGNVLISDTTKDLMYEPPTNNYWQQQTIHFKSAQQQTISVKITGILKRNDKLKVQFDDKIDLLVGEWWHNYSLHQIIAKQGKATKRKKLRTISVEIVTPNATYRRSLNL